MATKLTTNNTLSNTLSNAVSTAQPSSVTPARDNPVKLTPDVNSGRTFQEAVIYHFYYSDGKTVIQFRGDNGAQCSALIHPAIRVLPIMNRKLVLTVNDTCKPWKCTLRPTAAELQAYEARQQPRAKAYEKVQLSQADLDFTKSF